LNAFFPLPTLFMFSCFVPKNNLLAVTKIAPPCTLVSLASPFLPPDLLFPLHIRKRWRHPPPRCQTCQRLFSLPRTLFSTLGSLSFTPGNPPLSPVIPSHDPRSATFSDPAAGFLPPSEWYRKSPTLLSVPAPSFVPDTSLVAAPCYLRILREQVWDSPEDSLPPTAFPSFPAPFLPGLSGARFSCTQTTCRPFPPTPDDGDIPPPPRRLDPSPPMEPSPCRPLRIKFLRRALQNMNHHRQASYECFLRDRILPRPSTVIFLMLSSCDERRILNCFKLCILLSVSFSKNRVFSFLPTGKGF